MSHTARDRALSGSAVQNILNPVRGYRDELKRRGQPVKDHLRENASKLREIQTRNRELADAAEVEAARQPFKLDRFKQAQPLVFESKEPEQPPRPFLKRGSSLSRAGAAVANASARSDGDRWAGSGVPASYSANSLDSDDGDRGSRLKKPPVPRTHELDTAQAPRERKDFLRSNARAVIDATPDPAKRAPPSAGPTARDLNPNFGHVPDYLFERKVELAEREEQRRRASQPNECPPGMVLLSEAERVDSLARLRQNAEAVGAELTRMPLVIETQKATRRKRELEERLAQLEEAILLFSRPKVFVAADS